MRDPEEAIDRVLRGLRDAEAPEGLERRVLRAMAEPRAARRAGRRSGPRWSWAPAMSWMASGGVALTMLAVSLVVARLHAGGRPAAPVVAARRPAVEPHAAAPVRTAQAMPPVVAARRPSKSLHAPAKLTPERGFPAPPMPLTEQERLLLWLAHRSDPVQVMAMLNPEARALRDAEGDAEFNSFFPPPPKTEEETQPDSKEKGETR